MNSLPQNSDFQVLRYRFDFATDRPNADSNQALEEVEHMIRRKWLPHAIQIVPQLMPDIAETITRAAQKVLGPEMQPTCFLVQSGEIQAYCVHPGNTNRPLVIVTSAIVSLLKTDELAFVIGHEIGHFLFRHHILGLPDASMSRVQRLRFLAQQRCAEISADRVGLVACPSPKSAIRALLKVATGLDERFIRFDINAFMAQLRDIRAAGGSDFEAESTHPLFLLRVRALLWFEMSELYARWNGNDGTGTIKQDDLENRIHNDLTEISGFDLVKSMDDTIRGASLWGSVLMFLDDGLISQAEVELLCELFGQEPANKAVGFGRSFGPGSVAEKFSDSLRSLAGVPKGQIERLIHFLESTARDAGFGVTHEVISIARRELKLDS